jgi:hypothetical protein
MLFLISSTMLSESHELTPFSPYILAQTTDSGSNNFTMAAEVDRLMAKKTGVDPKLSANHIRFFCHKLLLILNLGLQSIHLSTRGLVQTQTETLGYIPDLEPILEESKEIKEAAHFTAEDVIVGSSHDKRPTNGEETLDVDVNDHSDAWETPKEGRNAVDTILKKVCCWMFWKLQLL